MKKCLHLKKTKRHWRRKPPKVLTWREKRELERKAGRETRAARLRADPMALGFGMAAGAAAYLQLILRDRRY